LGAASWEAPLLTLLGSPTRPRSSVLLSDAEESFIVISLWFITEKLGVCRWKTPSRHAASPEGSRT